MPSHSTGTPYKGQVTIQGSKNLVSDAKNLEASGYYLIGHSDFSGSHTPTIQEIKLQAQKVNASYVIYSVNYLNTVSEVRNVTIPNPSQIITTDTSGNIYGGGQNSYYYGTSTTTIPGGYSSYQIPYSIPIYETHEGYFARISQQTNFIAPEADIEAYKALYKSAH